MSASYVQMCENRVALARGWDLSHKLNRRGLRQALRRLWWARYGAYVSALTGGIGGAVVGIGLGCWLASVIFA